MEQAHLLSRLRSRPPSIGNLLPTEKRWAALVHFSVLLGLFLPFIGGAVGPLMLMLLHPMRSKALEFEATEALNFGFTVSIAAFPISVAAHLARSSSQGIAQTEIIQMAMATVVLLCVWRAVRAARKLKLYRYPFSLRFVAHPQGRLVPVR